MKIDNKGVDLGLWLGRMAGFIQWKAALDKYKSRVEYIYEAHENVQLAILSYNSKIVIVLGYVGQLASPPPRLTRLEAASLNRVLHLATSSVPLDAMFFLRHIVQPQYQLLRCVPQVEHVQSCPKHPPRS